MENDLMLAIAIGNLSMIAQAAAGEIAMKPGEAAERESWLVEYLRTGQGLVTDEARAMAERVRAALREPEAATAAGAAQ